MVFGAGYMCESPQPRIAELLRNGESFSPLPRYNLYSCDRIPGAYPEQAYHDCYFVRNNLGRRLHVMHWVSIALLCFGIVLAKTSTQRIELTSNGATVPTASLTSPAHEDHWYLLVGVAAVVFACVLSSLAAVLLEKLYKAKSNFWTLNVHLSFFSLLTAFVPLFTDSIKHGSINPLRYFNFLVWLLIFCGAVGGFISAMCLKFADNILKNFAIAAALMLTMLLNTFVTHETIFNFVELMGILIVILSMVMYAYA